MKKSLLLIGFLLIVASCARIVTPTGGPKDVAPPNVLNVKPENRTLHFSEKNIRIYFDEFITLNVPLENIVFSPPLVHAPEYLISGKSLIIKLSDTLISNKTYNVAFSNAIKDFREGNLLPFYQYTFSTGDYIDSFMVSGILINAETLAPEPNINILLYEENIDSLPYSTKPIYLTKSQSDGRFSFLHISKGNYKIFALKDINNNLIFDLPNEGIAFSDSLVTAVPIPVIDTALHLDSVIHHADSIVHHLDTLNQLIIEQEATKPPTTKLFYFLEEDTVQRLERPNNPSPGIYQFIYKRPISHFDAQQIKPESALPYMETIGVNQDTVTWYFQEPVKDTLVYIFTADEQIDTVRLLPYKAPMTRGRLRSGGETPQQKLNVSYSNGGEIFKPLTLKFSYPIMPIDSFQIMVVSNKKSGSDTSYYSYSVPDGLVLSLALPFDLEEKVPYLVQIDDSVFTGHDGSSNDTVMIRFTSKSEKEYGNLKMHYSVSENDKQYVTILLNSADKEVQRDIINSSTSINYMHLTPGEYKVKVIDDRNRNGKWDTGNYRKKVQPEKIIFFDKPITIRGYWDLEEDFPIKFE